MKVKKLLKESLFIPAILILSFIALSALAVPPLYADMWDSIKERYVSIVFRGRGNSCHLPPALV